MRILHTSAILLFLIFFQFQAFSQRGWVPQNSGITKTLSDVYFVDAFKGWAVGYNGTILRTSDGGENWELKTISPSTYFEGVWFTDTLTGWICGIQGKIFHTMDGGNSWIEQTSPLSNDYYDICFADGTTGWIVGDNGVILRTTNGGENWEFQFSGVVANLKSVSFTGVNNGWVTGGTETGVLLSTSSGGDTWDIRNPGTQDLLYSVFFINPYLGWIGLDNALLHTTDVGEHWLEQLPPDADGPVNNIWFTDVNHGWAVQGARLFFTDDGGLHWSQQLMAPPFKYFTAVHFVDTANGWAVGKDGIIYHTNDGGASGIDDLAASLITISPNPGNGLFYLACPSSLITGDYKVMVFDMHGNQCLMSLTVNNSSTPLDLRGYPDGIYLIRVGDGKESVVKKLVKLR